MLDAKKLCSPGLFLLMVGVVAAGCAEPECPKGYTKKGDTCYRNKDGGVADAGDDELDAGDVELEASTSGAIAGDGAPDVRTAEQDGESAADATSLEDGSTDPCQGSGGAAVCIGECDASLLTTRID